METITVLLSAAAAVICIGIGIAIGANLKREELRTHRGHNINCVLSEKDFDTLVSGHAIASSGLADDGQLKTVRMILQDIGYDRMVQIIKCHSGGLS